MRSKPSAIQSKAITFKGAVPAFPYDSYKGTNAWRIVEKAIQDLAENRDIIETTRRHYIVGYICKELQQL
jgi:hypothetical protein